MAESNLFKKAGDFVWAPDSDATAAPPGVLLIANNLVPDTDGALSLRAGSSLLSTTLGGSCDSIYGIDLDAGRFNFTQAGSQVWKSLNSAAFENLNIEFDGSGDIQFGDDSYQLFMARGTTKKKWDGESLREWGIAAPQYAPTVAAVTAATVEIASFASAESPAFTIDEGSAQFVTGADTTASGAMALTPNPLTGRASASKVFASDQNFFEIAGSDGADTDLFDMYVYMEEPRKVDRITVMLGLGTGADPYIDDYFYGSWDIDQVASVKTIENAVAGAVKAAHDLRLSTPNLFEVTKARSTKDAKAVIETIADRAGSVTQLRLDAAQWTHLSMARGQFKRVGSTSGRGWNTVRGFRVIYECSGTSTKVAAFDSAVFTGGGARSLTGEYEVAYRFVREQQDAAGSTLYYELSPLSPISDKIMLEQQALQITVSATAISAADPQVTQVWFYLHGGFLDTFYRAAVAPAIATGSSQVLDDFPADAQAWDEQDRMQVASPGFGIAGFSADPTLTLVISKSEIDVLVENEMLEPGAVGPPDNIVGIAGPWMSRMFVLTENGELFVSSATSPSNFSRFHAIDLRRYGDPLWVVKTSNGIHVGCSKDVINVQGDGNESADRMSVNLFGQPLNVGNPPVDAAHATDGNSVIYRSADGLAILTGATLRLLPSAGTSLLWRGQTRHNLEPLNTSTGRFRLAVDNQLIYMLASEGTSTSPTSIWRLDLEKGRWNRLIHPSTFMSIERGTKGELLAGAADGYVWELDTGTFDNATAIPVSILTPIDDGGDPLHRKDPLDLQIHFDTGGSTGTLSIFKDGANTAVASYTISATSQTIYRIDLSDLGPFIKLQIGISGSFFNFVLHALNVSYRVRTQHTMVVDTGYILPPGDGDITWISEAEIDANSPSDLSLLTYKDDVLYDTQTISVTPNVRTVYRTELPRGTKSKRPRLVVKTTAANGEGSVGFECYFVRVRHRGSGNQGGQFRTVWPTGQAD